MKINIDTDEDYPVFNINEDINGKWTVDARTFKRWKKVFDAYEDVQSEIQDLKNTLKPPVEPPKPPRVWLDVEKRTPALNKLVLRRMREGWRWERMLEGAELCLFPPLDDPRRNRCVKWVPFGSKGRIPHWIEKELTDL